MQARFCEALLKTLIQFGPAAMEEPDNYEARANLRRAGSLAVNGLRKGGALDKVFMNIMFIVISAGLFDFEIQIHPACGNRKIIGRELQGGCR